jgi:hypothetical protein
MDIIVSQFYAAAELGLDQQRRHITVRCGHVLGVDRQQ